MPTKIIADKKIDLYELMFNCHEKISVTLKNNFILNLRSNIASKYSSIYQFTKLAFPKKNQQILTSTYLKKYQNKRPSIPVHILKKILSKLKIDKKTIYKNVLFFSKHTGKLWQGYNHQLRLLMR